MAKAQDSRPKFVPRALPPWFGLAGDYLVIAALLILWAPLAWVAYHLYVGHTLIVVVALAIWAPLFFITSRYLHRNGMVRLAISITITLLFFALALVVVFTRA